MNCSDWEKVETLFHGALDCSPKERNAYLNRECGDDVFMRHEVESLLEAFGEESDFLEETAFDFGMQILPNNDNKSLIGKTFGAYKILEKLGMGGMGEVYLAEDTKLKRLVALKFLSETFVNHRWAKKQFIKEAQAVAQINHPNICAVYDIQEGEEHSFIVMQYIEGETLTQAIRNRRIEQEQLISIFRQIAEALAEAHSRGIIHRDIKPGNVMLTPNGQVKVLDFGLAKTVGTGSKSENQEPLSYVSQNGLIMGTVAYMSPEQLKAEKLDFRTDIFSLGTVLFELAYGKHPFARNSDAETISAILTSAPELNNDDRVKTSYKIYAVVKKCLEKEKENRYQSISELLLDLQSFSGNEKPRKNLFSIRIALALAFLLVLTAFGLFTFQPSTEVQKLAVLPFINESGNAELEYMTDGMTESLINKIAVTTKIPVKSFTTVSGFKNPDLDYVEIGKTLSVDALLTGKLVRRNEQIVLQYALVSAYEGSSLWNDEVSFSPSNPLNSEIDIVRQITSKLDAAGNYTDENYRRRQTNNPEAFKEYLYGRYYWRNRNKDNIAKAIEAFDKAIKIDPAFAYAYAALADAYVVQSRIAFDGMPPKDVIFKAKAAAREAIMIDDTLAESHASLALVLQRYDWDWAEAEKEFRRAIELNPNCTQAHYGYSELLQILGRFDEALARAEKVKELDPFTPLAEMNLGRILYLDRQYDEAAERIEATLEKQPDSSMAKYILGLIYIQKKMYEEAVGTLETVNRSQDGHFAAAALGYAYAKSGKKKEAAQILENLNQNPALAQESAIVYAGLGENDKALTALEKAYKARLSTLVGIKSEPLFDSLRNEQRFQQILQQMKLE